MKLTYEQRFIESLSRIIGVYPPKKLVHDWINGIERDDDLQQWVGGCGGYAPWWSQSIAILDACECIAMNPADGEQDKIDYNHPIQG